MTSMTNVSTLAERRKNIENIYPLAPMQEGLLFHTVLAPDNGLYVPQVILDFQGDIDADALHAAWKQAIRRHSVLRSGFHWEERDEPFQVVYRDAPLSWTPLDWSNIDKAGQALRLAELLPANRAEIFDLRLPPLLRLHWINCGEERHTLVLCYHHVILDGWSASQLVKEVFQLYLHQTGADVPILPAPRPYADYIAWLQRQDREAATAFWQDYLTDLAGPTRFLPAGTGASGCAVRKWTCSAPLNRDLKHLCQNLGITLNTVLQGSLGLLIASYTNSTDVVFGATTAGRPATLSGATSMIGLFINTLPVRVKIDLQQPLETWLTALQTSQASTVEHEYLPLREIQGEYGALFDCLLIFESYPVSTDLGDRTPFQLKSVEFDEWTHFPLALLVADSNEDLTVTARYSRDALDETAADLHLQHLGQLLEQMVANSSAALHHILGNKDRRAPVPMRNDKTGPDRGKISAPGGKPNGSAVARPDAGKTDCIAPTTDTEKILAAAWSDVLKRPEPGVGDDFFELGGHSLLAARVISRVRRELAMDLPVRSLFDRPVLSDLATYIDALRASTAPSPSLGHREIEI